MTAPMVADQLFFDPYLCIEIDLSFIVAHAIILYEMYTMQESHSHIR